MIMACQAIVHIISISMNLSTDTRQYTVEQASYVTSSSPQSAHCKAEVHTHQCPSEGISYILRVTLSAKTIMPIFAIVLPISYNLFC